MKMSVKTATTTTFTRRGRLTGLIRDSAPAGAGRDRAGRRAPAKPTVDEALYYRARLILGESLPRPQGS
jgi:hypothetical protein